MTEAEAIINVGVSGPGVVKKALEQVRGADFEVLCETIKKTAFKITRVGQLVAQEASRRMGIPFGIIDLSLAPTPAIGDSVAEILQEIGLEQAGMINQKTTAVRLIPVIGKGIGETVEFGGLLGHAPVMQVNRHGCEAFISRKGRIPAPVHSFKN